MAKIAATIVLGFLSISLSSQHITDSTKLPFLATCGLDHHSVLHGAKTQNSSQGTPTTSYPPNAIIACGKFELYFDDILISTFPNTQPALGFADPAGGIGATRINTLCNVLTYIQNTFDFSQIPTNAPIRINVAQSLTPGLNPSTVSWLGIANPAYINTGSPQIINGFIFDYVTTGNDPVANTNFHGTLTFNFDQIVPQSGGSFPISWQNDNTSPFVNCNYDLYTVMLHEVTHAMGWFSLVNLAPTLPGSVLGNDQYSGIDYLVYQGSVFPNALNKLILGAANNPSINPLISGNANNIQNNDLWINNLSAPDNQPVYSGKSPGASTFLLGSVISHLDEQSWVYSIRQRISPGDQESYVMGPFVAQGQLKRTFSKGEIQTLVTLGYALNPAFGSANPNIIPNRLPFSSRMANYTNYLADNFPDIVPADFPPLVNNIGASLVINLSTDPTLSDADGDPISVYPNSVFNIRGCGSGGNNHNCITVSGQQVTFTPRPGFFGRAQFGFNLSDGKEKGGFVIYTIDVLKGTNTPPCAAGSNLVVNGTFEEGTEVKRIGPEESLANDYYSYQVTREGRFRRGTIFGDGQRLNYSNANGLGSWPTAIGTVYVGDSWINCNGTSFTSDIVSPSFPSPLGFQFPLNAISSAGGQRYYNAHIGYYHNFDLCDDLQNCRSYILEFDYYSSNKPFNGGGPVTFICGFGNTTNVPYTTTWPNPVPTNYSFSFQLNSLNGNWQHVAIPFTYCSSNPSDMLNIAQGSVWTDFFIDNLSITENLNPPPLNVTISASTNPSCAGSPVTLTANAINTSCPLTHNWQSPINQTGQSVVVNPTASTTYNLISSDGCSTVNSSITINVIPPATLTVTASPATICNGSSAVLSVAPALQNPVWTGPNLSCTSCANPSASPSSSSVYNVSGTDANGCLASGSVTLPVQNCFCTGTSLPATITTNLGAGTYQIQNVNTIIPTGSNPVWTNAIIGITPNPAAIIEVQNGASLTLNGCHLFSCGTFLWGGIVVKPGGRLIINGSNPAKPTLIEDAVRAVYINATTLNFPNLALNISAAIFNKNETAISIDNYQAALTSYPYRISNTIITSRRLYTASPYTAVWPSTITLKTMFNFGTLQEHFINTITYPAATIKQQTSTTNITALHGIYLNNIGTYLGNTNPYSLQYGIKIGDMGATAVNFKKTMNLYDVVAHGIYAINSSFYSVNSAFQYMSRLGFLGATGGVGIYAINNSDNQAKRTSVIIAPPNPVATNVAVATGNRFYDCSRAAHIKNYYHVVIQGNDVRSTQAYSPFVFASNPKGDFGFYVNSALYDQYKIMYNRLTNVNNAIVFNVAPDFIVGVGFGQLVGPVHITNNLVTATLNAAPITNSEFIGNAITATNILGAFNTAGSVGSFINTNNNTIAGCFRGIYTANWQNQNVWTVNNYIGMQFETSAFSTPTTQYGIHHANNIGTNEIFNNLVDGFAHTHENKKGIYCIQNSGTNVQCNQVNLLGWGIEFNGQNLNTTWLNNTMQSNTNGFVLSANGEIGQQGNTTLPIDNQWTGTWTVGSQYKTLTHNTLTPDIHSPLWVRSGSTFYPTIPYNFTIGGTFFTDDYNASGALNVVSSTPVTILCPSLPPPPTCPSCQKQAAAKLMKEITLGQLSYAILQPQTDLIGRNLVFRTQKTDSSFINADSALTSFYNQNINSDLGRLTNIERSLSNYDISGAQTEMNLLSSANALESNYKSFYTTYINYQNNSNSVSVADSINLLSLAEACPQKDGPVVFQARAMYNAVYDMNRVFADICDGLLTSTSRLTSHSESRGLKSENEKFLIYPNPTSGEIFISYRSIARLKIELLDLTGRVVSTQTVSLETA